MSTVSVFVPCYNYGRFLPDSVGSVLSQDGVDVEVLIIDDASTDDSSEVGASLAASDPRVSYVRHARNLGHIATYNEGIDWASGDYLALLSADDMLTPGALKRAAYLMDRHPAVGFVYGGVVKFHSSSSAPSVRSPSVSRQWRVVDGHKWLHRHACAATTRFTRQRQWCAPAPSGRSVAIVQTCRIRATLRCGSDWPLSHPWAVCSTATKPTIECTARTCITPIGTSSPICARWPRLTRRSSPTTASIWPTLLARGRWLGERWLGERWLGERWLAREALDDGRLDWEGTSVQDIAAYAGQLTGARSLVTLDAGLWWRMRAGPRWAQQARPITYAANYPRAWLNHRLRRFRAC
jgi:glycosyltransferase involved in cell wall biosynthesis